MLEKGSCSTIFYLHNTGSWNEVTMMPDFQNITLLLYSIFIPNFWMKIPALSRKLLCESMQKFIVILMKYLN
jgi:hypothetical protein